MCRTDKAGIGPHYHDLYSIAGSFGIGRPKAREICNRHGIPVQGGRIHDRHCTYAKLVMGLYGMRKDDLVDLMIKYGDKERYWKYKIHNKKNINQCNN